MPKPSLKQFSLFADLPEEELEQLSRHLQERTYAPGHDIFSQGQPGGNLYLIEEGSVQISLLIQGLVNEHEKISVLKTGNFFGELSLFDGKEHSAKATALEQSKLLVLSRGDFKQIIGQDPQRGLAVQEGIILALTRIIRDINTRYADLSSYIAT